MKTLKTPSICLALLLLLTACGKPPVDSEDTPPPLDVGQPVSTAMDNSKELEDSIKDNNVTELTKLVKDNNINIKDVRTSEETPLIIAIKNKADNVSTFLVEKGANINEVNEKGETPLMVAVASNHKSAVEMLLKSKAKIDLKNKDQDTALHIAIKNRFEPIAVLLLNYGANYKITDRAHFNAYELAIDNKLPKLEEFLRKKMQIEISAPELFTFRDTITSGDLINLTLMLNKFPKLATSYESINPLGLTLNVKNENVGQNMANLLLSNGVNVNGPANADYSPLVRSVILQKQTFMEIFLNYNANVNLADKEGKSALIHAISFNNLRMVDILLARGALTEYKHTVYGKEKSFDACDVAKDIGKKVKKDAAKEKINKEIKDKLGGCRPWWKFF